MVSADLETVTKSRDVAQESLINALSEISALKRKLTASQKEVQVGVAFVAIIFQAFHFNFCLGRT